MADKPSRGLVLYGDGLARFMSPAQTHLNSLASRALCGFLALPHSPQSENEDIRIVREFAELLDANEAYESRAVKGICEEDIPQEMCAFPSVAERFMGLKAAIITDNLSVKSFGGMVGFKVFSWNEMSGNDGSSAESSHLASEVLKLLGFQEEKELDSGGIFELIFAHIGANTKMNGVEGIDLVNHLVGDISHKASPGSNIGSRLHMSVIMSYGATLGDKDLELSVSNPGKKGDSELSHLFPRQSYMMKAGKPRVNIRQHCPMLLAQYQHAVTRVDAVKSFLFSDFLENGGNLVIPVDRFLHEEELKLALFTETSGENLILNRLLSSSTIWDKPGSLSVKK
ncbi:uncharacterized protein LOC125204691 isoform X2 [Salvia hispanica]|uniref:uncharacterized protein LOC125204691 isoform X2 n=1 Tax=Salvia hispanica TaxID=49212 RepID=UPI0020091704|nr:uncharacterized protein LOC125204691 isoform X2 [Salvia hispanica]